MWNDPSYLELLAKLKDVSNLTAPLFLNFAPGDDVARGFADVGFEEFFVLQNEKLCSKFTGDVSNFQPQHFFRVPSLADIVAFLCELGGENVMLRSDLGNKWVASAFEAQKGEVKVGPAETPELAAAILLSVFLGIDAQLQLALLRTSHG
jgi:hypothetical protein